MIEEPSATAHHKAPGAEWLPGKTNARREVIELRSVPGSAVVRADQNARSRRAIRCHAVIGRQHVTHECAARANGRWIDTRAGNTWRERALHECAGSSSR